MCIIRTIATCIGVILTVAALAEAKEWRGIVPLHSTRADVERVLGSPTEPRGSIYRTENENISIWYSDEPCQRGMSELWNVPRGTVLSITVYPKAKPSIADLRLEHIKYKEVANMHLQGITNYTNDEEGVRIETYQGKVNNITYVPAAKDSYLQCPGSFAQQSSDEEKEYFIRKFDEYSNISFNDEKARLDNLAIYLQRQPEMKGYIIAYAGRRARVGEAQVRTERAKNYLVSERGIEAERIVTIDGGHREELEVDVYVLPHGVSAPTVTPTVDPSDVRIIKDNSTKNNRTSSQLRRKQRQPCQ